MKAVHLLNHCRASLATCVRQKASYSVPSRIPGHLHFHPPVPPSIRRGSHQLTMTERPVYFWRETSGDSPWMSQWYYAPFYDDDGKIVYATAEHYMMYQKAILFNDLAIAQEILDAEHPRSAKDLGRKVSGFDDKVWNANREQIVYKGNLLKVTKPVTPAAQGEGDESEDLLAKLLDTGDRELVEASPYDRIWGIGFTASKAEANRARWGWNLLGKALMKVRKDLREAQKSA